MLAALRAANDRMVEASEDAGSPRPDGDDGCGLVVVEVEGETRWAVFNIGDSRVYRYADGELQQVSADHSEVAELVQAGVLDPSDASHHPRRNVITRSLGHEPMLAVDLWVAPIAPGERYVLCTDGLTLELSDDELSRCAGRARAGAGDGRTARGERPRRRAAATT